MPPYYLPRTLPGKQMAFHLTRAGDALEAGPYGILQPSAENPQFEMPAGREDLVIVPSLAVNKEGCRLGRGGGYYDRARDQLVRAKIVSVLPDALAGLDFPGESHDLKVTTVITESGIHE